MSPVPATQTLDALALTTLRYVLRQVTDQHVVGAFEQLSYAVILLPLGQWEIYDLFTGKTIDSQKPIEKSNHRESCL